MTDRDQGPIPEGPPPLPPPADDPPPTRGRSPAPRRARSTSGSQPRATRQKRSESMETIRYPSEPPRSRSVSIGGTSAIRYPSEGPVMILPTIEDAYEQAAARRTRAPTEGEGRRSTETCAQAKESGRCRSCFVERSGCGSSSCGSCCSKGQSQGQSQGQGRCKNISSQNPQGADHRHRDPKARQRQTREIFRQKEARPDG